MGGLDTPQQSGKLLSPCFPTLESEELTRYVIGRLLSKASAAARASSKAPAPTCGSTGAAPAPTRIPSAGAAHPAIESNGSCQDDARKSSSGTGKT